MKFKFENAIECLIEDTVIEELRKYKYILIFGAGESGSWVQMILEKYNIYPCCFCDNYREKWGTEKNGLPVESFEHAIELFPEAAICIASMWQEEIEQQIRFWDETLLNRTWNLLITMNWETERKIFVSGEVAYIREHKRDFEDMAENLADDISRNTLEAILNYRLTRKIDYIRKIKSDQDIYLDAEVLSSDYYKRMKESVIIDGGAFDGDTIEYFIDRLGNNSNLCIHAYEIEEKNCKILEKKIKEFYPHRIIIHRNALWNESGELPAMGSGLSGRINMCSGGQNGTVMSAKIDDILNEKIGLIKLDIEGAERYALEGARNVIEKYHPVLAICAYHLQDDLLVLYHLMKSLNCDYKIYLRQYMNSSGDTIMYGVPELQR